MNAPPPLLALQGKYRLLRQLADAGALEQYLGATRGANRHLAIVKRVPLALAKNKPTVGAFLDEARTTARLRHPAIVQVLEVGDDGGTVAAAFEHVFGTDAEALLRAEQAARRTLPIPVALAMTAAVLDALGHAHQATDDGGAPLRLVHRDVSARNVILGYDGAIKLTGFGMAKHQARSEHTSYGVVRGQLAYVSPEQLKSGEVDARADLWAVGVLLYQLLTGVLPFERAGEFHVLKAIREEPHAEASVLRGELSGATDALLARALAKDPAERFATAEEMRLALNGLGAPASPRAMAEYVSGCFATALGAHRAEAMAGRAPIAAMLDASGGAVIQDDEGDPPEPAVEPHEPPRRAREVPEPPSRSREVAEHRRARAEPPPAARPETTEGSAPLPAAKARPSEATEQASDPRQAALSMGPGPGEVVRVTAEPQPLPEPKPQPAAPRPAPAPPPTPALKPAAPLKPASPPTPAPPPRRDVAVPPIPSRRGEPPRQSGEGKPKRARRNVRFRLVRETGLPWVTYPLVVLAAALLGWAVDRGARRDQVVSPLACAGPTLAILDPVRPHPKRLAPIAPPVPLQKPPSTANATVHHEVQLSDVGIPDDAVHETPGRHTGTLRLSGPRGTSIVVDGRARGSVPAKLTLAAGVHRLRFVSPAGAVHEESVRVVAGRSVRRTARSGKVVPPQPGTAVWP